MTLRPDQLHFFQNIGYRHHEFFCDIYDTRCSCPEGNQVHWQFDTHPTYDFLRYRTDKRWDAESNSVCKL